MDHFIPIVCLAIPMGILLFGPEDSVVRRLRYFLLAECFWAAYFVLHRSWAVLCGVAVFVGYSRWRAYRAALIAVMLGVASPVLADPSDYPDMPIGYCKRHPDSHWCKPVKLPDPAKKPTVTPPPRERQKDAAKKGEGK